MIYILDENGKEFAMAQSDIMHLMNFKEVLIGIDENGVFCSLSADGTERQYIEHIKAYNRKFEIVGFDYKCKHYRLISAGVAKENVARRLF